ncbi:hypothetical protein DL765_005935 [Monosporascus sp. GIB2]|nr:hypothetical protein DL765_005935 [Monosporascus sp. GIB2]
MGVAGSSPKYVGYNSRVCLLTLQERDEVSTADYVARVNSPSPPRNRHGHDELAPLGAAADDDGHPLMAVETNATKYFQEPWGARELGHYDRRYFRGEVPYEERLPALRLLVRSYLAVCRELGVETWLAHGSPLGWYWNGRIMPWDRDVDAQVTGRRTPPPRPRMRGPAPRERGRRRAGGTRIRGARRRHDHDGGPGREAAGEFLPDVNLALRGATRQRGQRRRRALDRRAHGALRRHHGGRGRGAVVPGASGATRTATAARRATVFEGVPASVPFGFAEILVGEYGVESLYVTRYLDYQLGEHLTEWIKMENAPPPPPPPSTDTVGDEEEEEVEVSAATSKRTH